jgi:hypothetical protein
MALTYYVALPFIRTEDGTAPGEAQECQSEGGPRECHGILPMREPSHSNVQVIRTLANFQMRSCLRGLAMCRKI